MLRGQFITRERVKSSGVLRLEFQGLPYGLLFVNKRITCNFPEDQQRRLEKYARQIAQVLHESWLPHQDPKQLKLVISTGKEISQTLNLEALLRILVFRLREIFGNDIFPSVLIYNNDRQDLEHLQSEDLPLYIDQFSQSQMRRLRLSDGICGLVARTRIPYNVPDVEKDPAYLRMYSKTRSEAAVPIMLDGADLYGVLDIEGARINQFSNNDVLLLTLIANNAARAIQNALSFQQSEHMQKKLLSLYSSAEVLATFSDRTAAVEKILKDACNVTGAHTAMILRKQGDRLFFAEVYPPERKHILISEVGEFLPLDGRGITVKVAREGKPILADSVYEYSNLFIDGLRKITGSELAVPIRDDGEVVGVLNLEHKDLYGLKGEDIPLVTSLANLTEVASKQAEGAQELEKHRQIFRKDLLYNAALESFNSQIGNIGGRLDNMRDELDFSQKKIDSDLSLYLSNEIEQAYSSYLTLFDEITQIKDPEYDEKEQEIVLTGMVREMVQQLQWQDHSISFQVNQPDRHLTIYARPNAVRKIIRLLVNNSVKALRKVDRNKPKIITISCSPGEEITQLIIEDNGPGISAELIQKLGALKLNKGEGADGNGIGCFLARSLVAEMNGTIAWGNSATGGAKVSVSIPLVKRIGDRQVADD
jgi:GAF domain-containing protein